MDIREYFWKKEQAPPCSGDCWHYSVFGGVEGCGQRETKTGNPWPEPIEPDEPCLYPEENMIIFYHLPILSEIKLHFNFLCFFTDFGGLFFPAVQWHLSLSTPTK